MPLPPTIASAVLLVALTTGARAAEPGFTLDEVAPGVYLHRGQHRDLDDPGRADSANVAYVEGDRCLAVIDSGGAIATGADFLAAIRARTTKPVCYVINTHVHFDHVLGNAAFVAPETTFVGHQALVESMAANQGFFAERFAAELGGPGQEAKVIGPTLTVETTRDLDLGGRVLQLVAQPPAHTAADVTVLDLQSRTLFTGDLLFRERLPVIDGSFKGWLAWMARAMQDHYTLVVPGHGPPDPAWPAGANAQLAYFEALRSAVREAIDKGELVEDAPDEVAADALRDWKLTGRAHRLNVSRAYRELEWD